MDQFSGWFYSSLLTSIGAQETPAYKKIFVHGFTLDQKGRKMSKSLGNVIAPSQIAKGKNPKGVDVLRYWVGSHACQSTAIQISDSMMETTKQEVNRIRNTLRFIISNLQDQESEPVDLKVCIHSHALFI